MIGGSVNDTFNITPRNYSYFAEGGDTIQGYMPSDTTISDVNFANKAKVVTNIDNSQIYDGEIVTGPGIADGTSISIPRDAAGNRIAGSILLSSPTIADGTNATLTFMTRPHNIGTTTFGSNLVTGLISTDQLFVGEQVMGTGIPMGTTIVGFLNDASGNRIQDRILLSNPVTTSGTNPVQLAFGQYANALMFLGDGNINLSYDPINQTDSLTVANPGYSPSLTTMTWEDGGSSGGTTYSTVNNVSIVGVRTLGGADTVTVTGGTGSKKFGFATQTVVVGDGGTYQAHGNVTIDTSGYLGQASLFGGLGNDTIQVGDLAYGSLVQGGAWYGQYNEIDIFADNGGSQIIQGPEHFPGGGVQENFQDNGVWIGGSDIPETGRRRRRRA